jgi:pyrroloquinoline quinone biosynthesis protein E
LNYKNIDRLYELLANIGVRNIALSAYTNSIVGRGGESLALSEENIESLYTDFKKVKQNGKTNLSLAIPKSTWHSKEDIVFCGALFHTMIILPNGNVTGCEQMIDIEEMQFGNIKDNSIMEIWNGSKADVFHFNKSHPTDGKCSECEYLEGCNTGCFVDKYYNDIPLYGRDIRCAI